MNHTSVLILRLAVMLLLLLTLAGCSSKKEEGKGGAEQPKTLADSLKYGGANDALFVTQTKTLATIAADEKPAVAAQANVHNAAPPASDSATAHEIKFNELGNGVAYKAKKAGKVTAVFNGKTDQLWKDIGAMVISPDGLRFAYTAVDDKNIWHLVVDGKDKAEFHHLGTPVFSPDSRHIAVQASANEDWYIVLDDKQNKGGKFAYDQPVFSADSTKIAYIENLDDNNKKLYIADLNLKSLRIVDSVVSSAVNSPDNRQIGFVIGKNAKERLVRINFDKPDVINEGVEYDGVTRIAFSPDGKSVAAIALKGNVHYLVLDNSEERLELTPAGNPVLNPVKKEAATVVLSPDGSKLHIGFVGINAKRKGYDGISGITFSKDGKQHAYVASKGKSDCVVVNDKEGSLFDKIVAPVFSPDGSKLAYRARKDGKRFVVVADSQGKTLRQHPSYEQVFQPVFSPDGKSLAYGVQDGKKLAWMVEKL
jgi:Tol biopolymer transport system component